jgi:hypothetical protein
LSPRNAAGSDTFVLAAVVALVDHANVKPFVAVPV